MAPATRSMGFPVSSALAFSSSGSSTTMRDCGSSSSVNTASVKGVRGSPTASKNSSKSICPSPSTSTSSKDKRSLRSSAALSIALSAISWARRLRSGASAPGNILFHIFWKAFLLRLRLPALARFFFFFFLGSPVSSSTSASPFFSSSPPLAPLPFAAAFWFASLPLTARLGAGLPAGRTGLLPAGRTGPLEAARLGGIVPQPTHTGLPESHLVP
mmetsp:Transcript_101089/g.281714  ORF Transcript_101089/g.281714 Transcript_101089/m.281714 type:complete len:215 (+) Transcript_101089:1149-1793(+)